MGQVGGTLMKLGKSTVKALVAFLAIGALSAQATPAMAAPVELTINCFNDLNMKDTLIPAYEKANPNVKIVLVVMHLKMENILF